MTAKEMFEQLGYKEVSEFNNILQFEKIENKRLNHKLVIEFVLNHEYISLASRFGKFQYGAFNVLSLDLLEAINTEIKELGWTNEDK